MPLAIAEFVDTDPAQVLQAIGVELAINHPSDDGSDGAPVDAQEPGDRRLSMGNESSPFLGIENSPTP